MVEDISVQEKLDEKLSQGEISQEEYDELFEKFKKLDILEVKSTNLKSQSIRNWNLVGEKIVEGGITNTPVTTSGKIMIKGSLECQRLSVSGGLNLDGDLTVVGNSIINGTLAVDGIVKFGGPVSTVGSITSLSQFFATDTTSISGKLEVEGDIKSSGSINISGKVSADNIISTDTIRIAGDLEVKSNVSCENFELSQGKSIIAGDLKANYILISYNSTDQERPEPTSSEFQLDSLPEIGKFVANLAKSILPSLENVIDGVTEMLGLELNDFLKVQGSISGKNIILAHTHVLGDVVGDDIILGDKVQIDGTVKYRNSLKKSKKLEVDFEKIS